MGERVGGEAVDRERDGEGSRPFIRSSSELARQTQQDLLTPTNAKPNEGPSSRSATIFVGLLSRTGCLAEVFNYRHPGLNFGQMFLRCCLETRDSSTDSAAANLSLSLLLYE